MRGYLDRRLPSPYLLLLLGLATSNGANAQNSMLRVVCDGEDVGAEVSVNGKVKGTCPIDMLVEPGTLKLRLEKKLAGIGERVFEQEIPIGADVRKKVEAVLTLRLNADGQKRETERLSLDRDKVKEEQEKARLAQQRKEAEQRAKLEYDIAAAKRSASSEECQTACKSEHIGFLGPGSGLVPCMSSCIGKFGWAPSNYSK